MPVSHHLMVCVSAGYVLVRVLSFIAVPFSLSLGYGVQAPAAKIDSVLVLTLGEGWPAEVHGIETFDGAADLACAGCTA